MRGLKCNLHKRSLLLLLPLFVFLPLFHGNNVSALKAAYQADVLQVMYAGGGGTVFNTWSSSGRSNTFSPTNANTFDYSAIGFTAYKQGLSGSSAAPYQRVRIQFEMFFAIGPNAIDNAPIFGCPKRYVSIGATDIVITDCDMTINTILNSASIVNGTATDSFSTNSVVYNVSYDIELVYLRSEESTTDYQIYMYGSWFSYKPISGLTSFSLSFSRPVITIYESEESFLVQGIIDALNDSNEKDEQDRSDIESQSSSTDSSASSSQSAVQSASGSVISHITSIVGAFSTSSSDCLINIDTGNLQLEEINLCSAPNEIRTLINNIMTLIVTVSVLLCSYSLIRQFLNIYESFIGSGGKA